MNQSKKGIMINLKTNQRNCYSNLQ